MLKKFFLLMIAALAAALLLTGCSDDDDDDVIDGPVTFAVIHINDIESRVLPYEMEVEDEDGGEIPDTISVGGMGRAAGMAAQIRSEVDASLLLSGGDNVLGYFYSLFKGQPEYEALSMMNCDAAVPGNHEFDFGADTYLEAISYSNFDNIVSNMTFDNTELSDAVKANTVIDVSVDGSKQTIKVGIFGLMTPDLFKVCNPGEGVYVDQDVVEAANTQINVLEEQDCDIIIALSHCGIAIDRQIATGTSGLDIIIGGHSHTINNETIGGTIILQAGSNSQYLGDLRFTYENNQIKNAVWTHHRLDVLTPSDQQVHNEMENYYSEYEESLETVIGYSNYGLDGRKSVVRYKESNLGNLICDSWLDWFGEADVAFINGGGIRGDQIYPEGDITVNTVNNILAFRNGLDFVELTGAQLWKVMEASASARRFEGDGHEVDSLADMRPYYGGFLQIGGMKVVIDSTKEPFMAHYEDNEILDIVQEGNRLQSLKVYNRDTQQFEDVNMDQTYLAVTVDWIAEYGGDGHYVFPYYNLDYTSTLQISTDVFMSYIQNNSPVSPSIDYRIQFTASK